MEAIAKRLPRFKPARDDVHNRLPGDLPDDRQSGAGRLPDSNESISGLADLMSTRRTHIWSRTARALHAPHYSFRIAIEIVKFGNFDALGQGIAN